MQIVILHQPGAENHCHQPRFFLGKVDTIFGFKPGERLTCGANQTRIKTVELFRKRIIDANRE
ncbi:Uncharacterised protein [Salmonella enterica subsp. enterica]|uniref:Uncharacterized protein n=1 Tax=Salmonella enterica I TaxID=59201 RepID=A0A379WNX6_SALET|nr:Uncharacterised protein [Salmonella enterica subsp. enterica]